MTSVALGHTTYMHTVSWLVCVLQIGHWVKILSDGLGHSDRIDIDCHVFSFIHLNQIGGAVQSNTHRPG